MLLTALVHIPWLAPLLWAVLYISDYTLTLIGARLYRHGADRHHCISGSYELTPYYQGEIDRLRRISPRFLVMLAVTVLFVMAMRPFLLSTSNHSIELYQFSLGYLILLEIVVHIRHLKNILSFSYMRRSIGVAGQLRVSKGLSYRLSAGELLLFSLAYLLFFLLTDRWFFFGGTLGCLVTSCKHWRLGQRADLALPPQEEETRAAVPER